jgi:ethanolamine transporter EutH
MVFVGFVDDRPKRSLSGAILSAVSSLALICLIGQLVGQYALPEVLQSLLEFQVPPILYAIALIVVIVIAVVIILQMPRK